MPTIQVTVEVQTGAMPDAAARELARSLVEAAGLTVSKVAFKAQRDRVKVWQPAAGKPGSTVTRAGRSFQVWAETPEKGGLWLIPTEAREGDAPIYKAVGQGNPQPHHSDGSLCAPFSTWTKTGRTESPCQHKSHQRATAAA